MPSPAGPYLLTAAVAAAVFGLALNDGTYGLTSRNSLAVAVWWALVLAVGLSLWPLRRPPRAAIVTGGLLAAFAVLTALSMIWADSAEKAFNEFNRVVLYLGVFAVAVVAGARRGARFWSNGLAIGITGIALLALASRLFPDLTGADDLSSFFPTSTRLSYPLDYWNGLGIFVALAFPLLLRAAVAERSSVARGAALAPLPVLVAVIYLTASRGGAGAALIGTLAFLALTGRRPAALTAIVVSAAGSAGVIAVLLARPELVDGPLQSQAAADQGASAAVLIVVVSVLTGLIWALASRLVARDLDVRPALGRALAVAVVVAVVAGIAAADPVGRFETFKEPSRESQREEGGFTRAHLLSAGGSGRWEHWVAAVDQFETRPLLGRGAGSYEAWWTQRATITKFVRDAHSLYLEVLGELGVAGLALLLGVFGSALAAAAGRLRAAGGGDRATIAALTATFLVFAVGAGIDWMWELTAVGVVATICLGLLTGPATAFPGVGQSPEGDGPRRMRLRLRLALRTGLVAVGLAVIVAEGVPLLAQTEIRASREAVARGDGGRALERALAARAIQPWAASPRLQLALVRERLGELEPARTSIRRAIDRDPSDWRLWLVSARIETKAGFVGAARKSLDRAEALNPRSPLFASK